MKKLLWATFAISLLLTHCQPREPQSDADNDPYQWLENVEGTKALEWVKDQNKRTKEAIEGRSIFDTLYSKLLAVFNDEDKIPSVSIVNDYVYNLWQDGRNERGIWRRMHLQDFVDNKQDWETRIGS